MTNELFLNGELVLHRKDTHRKRKRNVEPNFSSRMEKREYYKNINLFDIRNVLDRNEFLNDIRENWKAYVSQVYKWIQNNPVKKIVVTGIFTIILGISTISANAAWVQEYAYEVKNNENIEKVAMDHGVTVQEILDANGITSIDGKKILLPKVDHYMVTAAILNVRTNPSTESSIFTKYKKGDIAKVAFVENGWAGILIEGKLYYVSADYLRKIENEKANKSVTEYVIKSGDTYTKIARTIGITSSTIQELNPTVNPTKLKIGQKINVPNITTDAIIYGTQERTMYVTASSLRVRESATTSSSILGKLKLNDSVSVKTIKNGWAQIDFNGKAAYVSGAYLTDKKTVQLQTEINKNINSSSTEYVIKSGDTFTKIGRTIGVSASAIQELNPTINPTKLKIGQTIYIPSSINRINVVAQVAGVNPNGTFRFITSDGKTHCAKASGNLINELFQHQAESVTLSLEGKRGQQMTLISLIQE